MLLKELGVTAAKEKQFQKKGIFTAEDLVRFLPYKYHDMTQLTGLRPEPDLSCVLAKVVEVRNFPLSRVPFLRAKCEVLPNGEPLTVTWFRQNYLCGQIASMLNQTVFIAGKVSWNDQYKNFSITAPERFVPYDGPESLKVQPVYSKIAGMTSVYMEDKLSKALLLPDVMKETYPEALVKKYSDISMDEALRFLHQPSSMADVERGRKRLLFDELLYFAACNEWNQLNAALGSPFSLKSLKCYNDIRGTLPYELTADQDAAVRNMIEHVRQGKRLNALVQGDVGCGKTIVAILMIAAFVGCGYQAALMAPTQVLARQHYADITKMLEPYGVKIAYLGTDIKGAEKKKILAEIEQGTIQVIVGTHSVFGKTAKYKNLALIVTDEEHKFGVAQKQALTEKASAGVHCITMSATPIPRSLAQVIYGNSMQLHTIMTMPAGRKPVITGIATTKEKLFKYIIKQAREGHQTYVVCPMIEHNDKMDGVRSVEEVSREYSEVLSPYGIKVETLTGKDSKDKEKTEAIINRFKTGETMVLIATTVVEVGVNVPTATAMVIVDADRFGLAALHQLRGRVGRGSYQSFCILDSTSQNPEAIERLNVLVNNSSGFDIAKEDLRIRGAGDFIGTKQSGENKYLSLMLAYPEEYKLAQTLAKELIDVYGWTPPEDIDAEQTA